MVLMDFMVRKILITGGLGFIGSSLIASLKRQYADQIQITVLDNSSYGGLGQLASALGCPIPSDENSVTVLDNVVVHHGDVTEQSTVQTMVDDADAIVHLAAQVSVPLSTQKPAQDFEQNVVGLFHVLDAARMSDKKPKIVFASSNAALGEVEQPVSEVSLPKPISPYGASKLASETFLQAFSHSYGMNHVALRFGNVFGPGSFSNTGVVAKFIRQALGGEVLEIYGDGAQTRDFIYMDDLVSSIEQAVFLNNTDFELFQISSGLETTVSEVVEKICQEFVKAGLQRPDVKFGEKRSGDIVRNVSDVSRAKDILNWHAKTSFDKGIAKTVKWFLDQQE